ncbi:MAG: hypothetical protein PHF14_08625 [Verrucomicrobiota bacterium]|nr:hypothetical protein [Verrucomicrobiota bacterium]MDD8050133.1 hypothetical protein [Verrucomicrobiota bacterium]MDI9383142.1 hypothetical protein [Verrucomicrobiota bacterium]
MNEIRHFLLESEAFGVVIRMVHLFSIVLVVGSLVFFRLVFLPYADTLGERFTDARKYARRRTRIWLWLALLMIAVSGGLLWFLGAGGMEPKVHTLLQVKTGIWALITLILLIQTLPAKRLSMMKRHVPFYTTVVLLLSVFCFLIAAVVQLHAPNNGLGTEPAMDGRSSERVDTRPGSAGASGG